MNKCGKRGNNIIEAVFAIIIGFLLVTSIPELKFYFDQLVGAIFTGIVLSLIVAGIIFVSWYILSRK